MLLSGGRHLALGLDLPYLCERRTGCGRGCSVWEIIICYSVLPLLAWKLAHFMG